MVSAIKNGRISVIIPIYGQFSIERARLSVKSILTQEIPDLEVVISEQGEEKKFPTIKGINHLFRYYKTKPGLSNFNPGYIRNEGIRNSTGEFVYTNDADIVLPDKDYLSKAKEILKSNSTKVLFRPKMRRLPIGDFNIFNKWVEEYGITKAIAKLNFGQDYLATIDDTKRKIRVFEKDSIYKKTFTAFEEDFQDFITGNNKGREPIFWNENRHCGGNLFRRNQFEAVGGYCEDFINWGCEDSDLQWKFSENYELDFFPDKLEVIHLDHPKEYFSKEMWARNEHIISQRKKRRIEKVIEHDRRKIT